MTLLDGMQISKTCVLPVSPNFGYQVQVSQTVEDSEWDGYIADAPGGNHAQTSLWAQVKALRGWKAVRIKVIQDEQIVAGAQLLLRSLRLVGTIGYVPKGPVISSSDPELPRFVMEKLHELVRAYRLQYLLVQPPSNGDNLATHLPDRGFCQSLTRVMPAATVLIDLSHPLDKILAGMRKKTRYGVRRSQKDGVTVREGAQDDLPTFHRLLTATSQRQGFSPFPLGYFSDMWHILDPPGYLKLFISEYEGEPVSAQLILSFGDTATAKQFGWSGRHGVHRPNEALDWATIKWAKSHGYRYYDLEGIDRDAAKAALSGEAIPEALQQTPTSYKLGFGGQVVSFPDAIEYVHNPLLRGAYFIVFPKIAKWPLVNRALNRFRIG